MKKNNVTRITFIVLIFCVLSTIIGCGYRLGSLLPPDLKTIAVPMFKNKTSEPELEVEITNGIIQELIYDGTLEIVEEDDADTILLGEIVNYRRSALRFDAAEATTEYRLQIYVNLKFVDLRNKKVMWTARNVYGETTFFIEGSLPESERLALPDAIEDLGHEVVQKVVEGGW